jgi:hypothetical protein
MIFKMTSDVRHVLSSLLPDLCNNQQILDNVVTNFKTVCDVSGFPLGGIVNTKILANIPTLRKSIRFVIATCNCDVGCEGHASVKLQSTAVSNSCVFMLNLWGTEPTMVYGPMTHFKYADYIVQYLLVRVAKQTVTVWRPPGGTPVEHSLAAHWLDLFWVSFIHFSMAQWKFHVIFISFVSGKVRGGL